MWNEWDDENLSRERREKPKDLAENKYDVKNDDNNRGERISSFGAKDLFASMKWGWSFEECSGALEPLGDSRESWAIGMSKSDSACGWVIRKFVFGSTQFLLSFFTADRENDEEGHK